MIAWLILRTPASGPHPYLSIRYAHSSEPGSSYPWKYSAKGRSAHKNRGAGRPCAVVAATNPETLDQLGGPKSMQPEGESKHHQQKRLPIQISTQKSNPPSPGSPMTMMMGPMGISSPFLREIVSGIGSTD